MSIHTPQQQQLHPHPQPPTTQISPSPSLLLHPDSQPPPDSEELRHRLEKLCRHYDVDTMKVFIVVEALGESSLHAVYSAERKGYWDSFLTRREACRLDLTKHDKTRDKYHLFLSKVGREEQGRQWFYAVLNTLHQMGAADVFNYLSHHANSRTSFIAQHNHHHSNNKLTINNLHSPRRHEALSYPANTYRKVENDPHQYYYHSHRMRYAFPQLSARLPQTKDPPLMPLEPFAGTESSLFCHHLIKLFEKKLETWFDAFHAVAMRLTAHVKVAGLVRVLTGQVHALCTRQGRLHAVAVKVTAQETPRPLDVAELCLVKVMVIQNGLALPEELSLALLTLHVHPARPVLRLWQITPSPQMETAIRMADIDDMIDAGRLSQQHELWLHNTSTQDTAAVAGSESARADKETGTNEGSNKPGTGS